MKVLVVLGLTLLGVMVDTCAVEPEVAELSFGSALTVTNSPPLWIRGIEQQSGQFIDHPNCWHVDSSQPVGQGRLSILLDRQRMQEDLALTVLYAGDEQADLVVQLFDAQDQVLVLDLFGNLLEVGKEAKTDTFIVALRRYPTANKITIRRIRGDIKVFGAVLYPVVTEAEADRESLQQLAKLLGDAISPNSPLVKGLQHIASNNAIPLKTLKLAPTAQGLPRAETGGPGHSDKLPSGPLSGFWELLPLPRNSGWPGARGKPSVIGEREIVLDWQNVRSRSVYSLPLHIEAEVYLERRAGDDGSFDLRFVPAGQPRDLDPDNMVAFRIIYSNTGAYGSVDRLSIGRQDPESGGREVWTKSPFVVRAGEPYRVKLDVFAERLHITLNGHACEVEGVRMPSAKFHIQLQGWQPGNRWHVRNFSVH